MISKSPEAFHHTVPGEVAFARQAAAIPLLPGFAASFLALLLCACGGGGNSDSAGSSGSGNSSGTTSDGSDYSVMANWVCRPGEENACTMGLNAEVQNADGSTESQPFTAAADPAIDCFYVYPTVSKEQTVYADLTDSPEIQAIAKAQVGRLSSRCRVFAPIYRQVTLYGLNQQGQGGGFAQADYPTADVQAAWAYYLANDNQGRGVVLIGHSQGTILLQSLIAESIDGRSSQKLLVSAFLAGDPSLAVPSGGKVGGTFAHIPTCSDAAETGCVYAWGSYLAGDNSTPMFGGARFDGLESACVNPAAPAGGSSMLKFYHENSSPPWVEALGQVSGECRADGSGANIFVVTVEPGIFADADTTLLVNSEVAPGWGLHTRDIALVQGNILDVLDAQIATWQANN